MCLAQVLQYVSEARLSALLKGRDDRMRRYVPPRNAPNDRDFQLSGCGRWWPCWWWLYGHYGHGRVMSTCQLTHILLLRLLLYVPGVRIRFRLSVCDVASHTEHDERESEASEDNSNYRSGTQARMSRCLGQAAVPVIRHSSQWLILLGFMKL